MSAIPVGHPKLLQASWEPERHPGKPQGIQGPCGHPEGNVQCTAILPVLYVKEQLPERKYGSHTAI